MGDANAPTVVSTSYTDNAGREVRTGMVSAGKEYKSTYQYDYLGNMTQALSALDASNGLPFTVKLEHDHLTTGRI